MHPSDNIELPASFDQQNQQRWMWAQQPTRAGTYPAFVNMQQQQQPQQQQQHAHPQPLHPQQPQHLVHQHTAQPYAEGAAYSQQPLASQQHYSAYAHAVPQSDQQLHLQSAAHPQIGQQVQYAYSNTSPQYPSAGASPRFSQSSPGSRLTPSPASATQPLQQVAPIITQPIPPSAQAAIQHSLAHGQQPSPFSTVPLAPRMHLYHPRPTWDPANPDMAKTMTTPPRACVRCKRLKVRCENVNGTRPCKRCRNANQECVTAQRKQRPRKSDAARAAAVAEKARLASDSNSGSASLPTPPGDAHPYSLDSRATASAELSEEDTETSDDLDGDLGDDSVEPPQTLPEDNSPLWWIKQLALATESQPQHRTDKEKKEKGNKLGITSRSYWRDDGRTQPKSEIFQFMSDKEVGDMFDLFMEKINPYMSMFDEAMHTVQWVGQRSPFLLSVMVAIAARYYTARPDVYPKAMEVVRKAAGDAITSGQQSVEHCQSFILLSVYPPPDRKYSDKKDWLYSGVAFRMATELGLGKPQPTSFTSEMAEREALNRTRTWIVCFYVDQSMSAHFGRHATFRADDPVARGALDWCLRSPRNRPDDLHLGLFIELLRRFRKFLDEANPDAEEAEKRIDYYALSEAFDGEVAKFEEHAQSLFAQHSDRKNHVSTLREKLVTFVTQYSRLIVHSTGFQKQVRKPGQAEDVFLKRCMDAAFSVLSIVTDDIYATGALRYACDGYFWYTSFASAFLLKFLSPEHAEHVDDALRERIVSAVQGLIDVLSSKDVAIDSSHPPKLFSRFLAGMLAKHGNKSLASPDETMDKEVAAPEPVATTSYRPPTPALTASPPKSANGLSGSPAAPPIVMPAPAAESSWQPDSGYTMDVDELMRDVTQQEIATGMFILDHPHWWHDPLMPSGDLAALANGSDADAMFAQNHPPFDLDPAFMDQAYAHAEGGAS